MEELHDESLFSSYMKTHQLQNVFHQKLISHVSLWRYQQGELVCSKGDKREYMYLLVKGKLKIFTTTKEGKTFILCFKTHLKRLEILNTFSRQIWSIQLKPLQKYICSGFLIKPSCGMQRTIHEF